MDYDNFEKISSHFSDIVFSNQDLVKSIETMNKRLLSSLSSETTQAIVNMGKLYQSMFSDPSSFSTAVASMLDSITESIRQSLEQSDFSKAGLELLHACQPLHSETEEPLFEIGEDYVDISELLAEAACDVDDSLSLPNPSSNNMVRIFKVNRGVYWTIISIIVGILMAIYGAHSDDSFKNEVLDRLQQIEENTATDQSPE